jgi:integrase
LNALKLLLVFTGSESPEMMLRWEGDWTQRVQDFTDALYGRYAPGSLKQYVSAIKTWLRRNRIEVGALEPIRMYTTKQYKAFSRAEIRSIVDVADLRTRVITLFAYQGGARITSLCKLNYGMVKQALEAGTVPLPIRFHPTQTKYNVRYTTFVGTEAVDALHQYLRSRREGSVALPGEIITESTPLFVKYSRKYQRWLRVNRHDALRRLQIACRQVGITLQPYERIGNHAFRNAFQRELQVAGVNQVLIEKLMGHKLDNTTTGRYSIGLTTEDLQTAWRQADFSLRPSEATVRQLREQQDAMQQRYDAKLQTIDEIFTRYRMQGPDDIGILLRRMSELEGEILRLKKAQRPTIAV